MEIPSSLEDLQINERRRVLDAIAQVRKCGLEDILSLPQLVMCGDQSAGKSSVLEALTETPIPRNDNLCTRFAMEIILRPANANSLKIKLIPDPTRPFNEQASIKAFEESITDFDQLPSIIEAAMEVMETGDSPTSAITPKTFARDILSIQIQGPSRPQLTLVDMPGLIQNNTKGVPPTNMDSDKARLVLVRTEGQELSGNLDPFPVGEPLEQISKWLCLAVEYLEQANEVCRRLHDIVVQEEDRSAKLQDEQNILRSVIRSLRCRMMDDSN